MSNDFYQLLLCTQQAGRIVKFADLKPELQKGLFELAIACGLQEDDCKIRDYMITIDGTVQVKLWRSALTNIDEFARQYYQRRDQGSGIVITGHESEIPGPTAAFEHIQRKLANNRRSSDSANAHILVHLINEIASKFVAVDRKSPGRLTNQSLFIG